MNKIPYKVIIKKFMRYINSMGKKKEMRINMKFLIDLLKGMVVGIANIIPGVSGGTMMVSMGIYEKS